MHDRRMQKLARNLVRYSCRLKKGEKVLIEGFDIPEEMIALVSELAPIGGVYVLHERSSGTKPMWYLPSQDPSAQPSMLDNIQELIDVSEATGVVSVATHIKVKGTNFWGSAGALIQLMNRARKRGVRVYADQYPYTSSGSDGSISFQRSYGLPTSSPCTGTCFASAWKICLVVSCPTVARFDWAMTIPS